MNTFYPVIAIFLAGLIYFANKQFGSKKIKEKRINTVVDEYIKLSTSHPPITTGLDGIMRAGISSLANKKEIIEACERIEQRVTKHPFGSHKEQLVEINLKTFFDYVTRNNINFDKTSIEDVLKELNL